MSFAATYIVSSPCFGRSRVCIAVPLCATVICVSRVVALRCVAWQARDRRVVEVILAPQSRAVKVGFRGRRTRLNEFERVASLLLRDGRSA